MYTKYAHMHQHSTDLRTGRGYHSETRPPSPEKGQEPRSTGKAGVRRNTRNTRYTKHNRLGHKHVDTEWYTGTDTGYSSTETGNSSSDSGCRNAHIHQRKTSRRKSRSVLAYQKNGRPYAPAKPRLDPGYCTDEGMIEVNKLLKAAARERYNAQKTTATVVENPQSHIEEGQKIPLSPAPKPKGLKGYLITALNILKTGSYYIASIGIYAGTMGVLASAALATFSSILSFAIPPLVIALVISGGIAVGACIGFEAAHKGESLLPTKRHWTDIMGMTNYWGRLEMPTPGAMNLGGVAGNLRR